MKKQILMFFVAAGIMAGCQKEAVSENPLIGKWNWIKSVGGITGNHEILPQEGGKRTIEFFENFTYRFTQTGPNPVTFSSTYSITMLTDIQTNEQKKALILYDETMRPQIPMIFTIEDDELKLKENCADCYTNYYRAVAQTQ